MQDRIPDGINNAQRVALHGTVHRLARPEFDRGSMAASTVLEHMTLIFSPSAAQQQELNTLIAAQQDRNSALYHEWLSPEEFGTRFGLSDSDLAKVKDWLQQQGFTITEVAPSRNSMTFSGTVAQVQTALHTEIHRFEVQGAEHFANVSDPALPAELAGVVSTIRGLHNFHPHPHAHAVRPRFTSYVSGNHFVTPDDFATIYDLKPLYQNGIDGTGQKIAIVGQTDIQQSDIDTFRSISGLPATNLTQQLDGTDPGTVNADLTEADLDIEWAGAVAPGAQIVYVRSTDAFESLRYAVQTSPILAPVVSVSYGECEPAAVTFTDKNPNGSGNVTDIVFLWDLGQQAATEGITVVAASGDSGAADCDPPSTNSNETLATKGLAVDVPGAVPFVTSVGGTQFNDTSNPSQFWNNGNNVFQGSALGYIPESVWNTTAADNTMAAGGGGVSAQFTVANNCGISIPNGCGSPSVLAFQAGITPDGGTARDVPDIALAANVDREGLVICSAGSCTNGYRKADTTLNVVGGTSAGTPSFAAMVALLNQMENVTGQGTINPALYKHAGSSGFHDITSGDNKIPCQSGSTNCPTTPATQNCPVFTAPPSGVSANNPCYGFAATAGYDLASGLGSVDAYNLLTLLHTGSAPSAPADFSVSASTSTLTIARGGSANFQATFTATSGTPSPINVTCFVAGGADQQKVNGMTCTPSASVAVSGVPITFNVTAASQVSSVRPAQPFTMPWSLAWTAISAMVLCGGTAGAVRNRKHRGLFAVFFSLSALAAAMVLVSCGGGSSSSGSSNGTSQSTSSQPAVSSISLSPSAVIGTNSSSGAVTLASAAPSGGTTVSLTSNSATATVPSSVTVPAGATTANFNISTTSVTTPTAVTITASTSAGSQTATLNVANVVVVVQGSFDLRGGTQPQFGSTVHVAAVPVALQ